MPATTFDLRSKRIILTGGAGFVGRVIHQKLLARGVPAANIFVPRRRHFDLTAEADARRLYTKAFDGPGRVDCVIHLAAEVGGIGANRDNPGRYFYANMAMALHLIEQGRADGLHTRGSAAEENTPSAHSAGAPDKSSTRSVEVPKDPSTRSVEVPKGGKFVQVGTICSYPKFTPVPFVEDELWNGYPEETNAPYGVAKKAAGQMLDAYRLQYGLRCAYVLPVNLYGPHDNFDLHSSHVIPALIRKCVEAQARGDKKITCWGTGAASREFLYVDDVAEGIVRAAEVVDEPTPINLGAGFEITIKDLVELIVKLTGFSGGIEWDHTKPDGQPRRSLSTSKAEKMLGWKAQVGFEEGLKRTIEWWRANGGK
ncbi:MAG: GDP-L-fucose synthase family protein [Phycisphaerales bacterium]